MISIFNPSSRFPSTMQAVKLFSESMFKLWKERYLPFDRNERPTRRNSTSRLVVLLVVNRCCHGSNGYSVCHIITDTLHLFAAYHLRRTPTNPSQLWLVSHITIIYAYSSFSCVSWTSASVSISTDLIDVVSSL